MAEASRALPKFPWDYDVPDDPFWNTLDHNIGRSFFLHYTEAEISQMTFDASLTNEEKLQFLRNTYTDTLIEKEKDTAPIPLYEADYPAWMASKSAICHMDFELGDLEAAERNVREQLAHRRPGPDGKMNESILWSLMGVLKERGKYAEAESTALRALDWISGHKMCGPNSPQALGCIRTLIICVGKQGRYSEAQEWVKRCEASIEEMAKTDFKKYVADEKAELAKQVKLLEQWRLERSAKI